MNTMNTASHVHPVLRDIIRTLDRMGAGQYMTVSRLVLCRIESEQTGNFLMDGVTIIDQIYMFLVGSAFSLLWSEDWHTGKIIFQKTAESEERYYQSPDRREFDGLDGSFIAWQRLKARTTMADPRFEDLSLRTRAGVILAAKPPGYDTDPKRLP